MKSFDLDKFDAAVDEAVKEIARLKAANAELVEACLMLRRVYLRGESSSGPLGREAIEAAGTALAKAKEINHE